MNFNDAKFSGFEVLKVLLIPAVLVFGVVSCSDTNTGFQSNDLIQSGMAKMNIHLTDAPADFQEVNIDVQGLRIHFTPFESDTGAADSLEDGRWVDLPVDPMRVNLLELQNGVDTLLASAELEPGRYRELRLLLGSDNDVMVDSVIHRLKVPSGQQSGFKVKFSTDLQEGEELDIMVDFDASRSVHKAGKSGKFILKPVLKAFAENGDDVDTGSVSGIVEPVEADPELFAILGGDTLSSTRPDTTGAFLFQGLEAGTYPGLFMNDLLAVIFIQFQL